MKSVNMSVVEVVGFACPGEVLVEACCSLEFIVSNVFSLLHTSKGSDIPVKYILVSVSALFFLSYWES